MFASQETQQQVAATARALLAQHRNATAQVEAFNKWLQAQDDSSLTGLGFSPADVAVLKGAFADMHSLSTIAYGAPVPAGVELPYDFTRNATEVIGTATG